MYFVNVMNEAVDVWKVVKTLRLEKSVTVKNRDGGKCVIQADSFKELFNALRIISYNIVLNNEKNSDTRDIKPSIWRRKISLLGPV